MQSDGRIVFGALLGKQAGFAKASFPDVLPIALLILFSIPKVGKGASPSVFYKRAGVNRH